MVRPRILSKSITSFLVLAATSAVPAVKASNIWDGGGTTDLWSDVLNWDDNAFPGYGTLTFAGSARTTNVVDANISQNMLLWTGSSAWTLNNGSGAVISLFDNGGVQAKLENQSTGLVTINAPITFAATAGANWGEINAVNGGLTFGTGTLTVNGSGVNGIRMFGGGQTTTFNNIVNAAGKYFSTSALNTNVVIGGTFTAGDFYLMNGGTLALQSGASLTTTGLRLGGDFATTGTQDLSKGATFRLASATGGQTFASNINSVTGNTSGALLVDSQNTSGTNTISGSVFLDSPLTFQQAAGGTLAITGVVSNASSLTKSGAGTLTLSNTNTYGGGTTLAAGTLNLGAAGALGAGALTVSGNSTLDNTSGAAITTPAAKALNINADLAFTGTNNLSFNLGTLTFGGAAGTRTVNVANGVIAVGLMNSNAGVNVTKTGAGILAMGQSALANTSTLNGVLDIQAGKVQMNSDLTLGGLAGSGTIENGGVAGKWLFVNQSADTNFSGTISDGPNPATVRLGLVKRGTGTLDLSNPAAVHTAGDRFVIEQGTVRLAGTLTGGYAAGDASRMVSIGNVANQNGRLIIDGGTLNAPRTASPSMAIGVGANARGFVSMSSGTINAASQFNIGNGSAATTSRAYAVHSQTGGTLNSGSWLVVGANFDRAILNQSGGTINVQTNRMTIGAGGNESYGIVNVSGGTLNSNGGIFLGENGQGIMNISGTGTVNTTTNTFVFGNNATSIGASLNLNGGTLAVGSIVKGASTAGAVYRLNFNGGTLKANASTTTFLADLANTTAYVNAGGAIFDTNNFNVTVAEPLLAPTGLGVSAIAVATGGAGYLDTPFITLSGGTGTGATAVANVSGGQVTGFTITSPGVGYTAGDVLTVSIFGGGATTAATAGTITLGATASGGFAKNGAGTLTLTNRNTYTGATVINEGTVVANPGNAATNGSFSYTSGITINSGATLQAGPNGLFGWDGTQVKPITVNAGATLATTGAGVDVNVGNVTLNGGTLAGAASATWGSFSLKRAANAKIFVTDNSTVSALDVGLGATNGIDVSGGKTLTFSGTLTDSTGETVPALNQGILNKSGAGVVNFTNVNTFTGATAITGGTVQLSGPGSINNSSGITLNGGDAKLLQTSTTAISPVVTVASGTVDGTGTINTVNVGDLATNVIANGNGGTATLTIGTLTFAGAGKTSVSLGGATPGIVTTGLVANGAAGSVAVNATKLSWDNGVTYDLIGYGGGLIGGTGFSAFTKGTVGNLGARQNATLGNSGTAITLTIAGDLPIWTGLQSNAWTTATIGGNSNWRLQSALTNTDFLVNDTVLFADTIPGGGGPGATTVNIVSAAGVAPTATTFNNSALAYTITATGGSGITSGTFTKNGTGTLNIGGTHSYSGATQLNAGTTNITGSLGNTAVTVGASATLNLAAANAITANTVTVDGTFTESVDNALGGTAQLVLNNGGTLNRANAHSGGTRLTAGTLNFAHPAGAGTGVLTIAGGAIDNTSGSALTLANNPARLLADLNFTGTNPLNLGTGGVTLGSDAAAQTINITAGNALTIGGGVTAGVGGTAGVKTLNLAGSNTSFTGNLSIGSATGLVIVDNLPGTLTLSGAASAITTLNMNGGASSIVDVGAGNLSLGNGGGNILQSTTGGTINGTGTVTIGSANGDFGTAGGTTLAINAKLGGTNAVDFWNANAGTGFGTIQLNNPNNSVGGANVQNTRLVIPATGGLTATNNAIVVADGASAAQLDLNGGTVNANRTASPGFAVATANGSVGTVNMTGGAINVTSEMWLSNSPGTQATMNMSGGQVTGGGWFVVGRDRGTGTLNFSGGTITKGGAATTYAIIGSLGGTGTFRQTAGAFNVTSGGMRLGENTGTTPALNALWDMQGGTSTINGEVNVAWRSSQATWNVSGNSTVTSTGRLIVGAETANTGINAGPIVNGAPVGTVNISGGSVTFSGADNRIGGDNSAVSVNAQGIVNVSGGTLNFGGNVQIGAYGKGTMTISGTGAVNSTAGFPVVGRFAGGVGVLTLDGGTFAQSANGNALIIGEEGTGTLNLNNGSVIALGLRVGAAATGNGTVNLNGGTLTTGSITKSAAGSTAAFKLNGGTLQTTAANADLFSGFAAGSVTVETGGAEFDTNGFDSTVTQALVPGTAGGGLTKLGAGKLTLVGANTYTGVTFIEGGTLAVTGSISGSSSINVSSGATLDVNGVGGGFVLGSGQALKGTGTVVGDVVMAAGASLAPGQSPGALNFADDLNIAAASAGSLAFELGAPSDKVVLSLGTLSIGSGLGFSEFAFSTGSGFANGTYTLFDTNAPIFGTLDSADLSGSLGAGKTGTLQISADTRDIQLVVVPEPGSAVVLLAGLGSVIGFRRNRRRSE